MIIFASFETEFSSHGGLGAVMKLLPREIGPKRCAVIAPWFQQLIPLDKLKKDKQVKQVENLFTYHVLVRGIAYPVEVIEVTNKDEVRHFLLGSPGFFQTPCNPYLNPCSTGLPLDPYRNPNNSEKLAADALLFSLAVPVALVELLKAGRIHDDELVIHMQDWETAAIAKAFRITRTAPAIERVRCVLTIHNPYDKPLSRVNSQLVCDFAAHLGFEMNQSILQQVIPFLDAPVSTVSTSFAHELRNEVLYTQVFCPHLQPVFKEKGLVGIDNGIFGAATLPFSPDAFGKAERGDYSVLLAEKREKRMLLASVLGDYQRDTAGERGDTIMWGGPLDLSDPALPVFFLIGRDDPRQKGFDVMVEAIRMLPRGKARYIFAVMPGDEGLPGLKFMRQLAEEFPSEVCVLPSRVAKPVFEALRQGSSFLVMGSMYEPFGAANEGYLSGMPVVGRATGGLLQPVAPHSGCMDNEALLSLYGRHLVRLYHGAGDPPSGILFREHVDFADEVEGWRDIVACDYWDQNPKGDRIEGRRDILLFRRMSLSGAAALQMAMRIYADPPEYAAMIMSGWAMLDKFKWSRAINAYQRLLYET
jgi:glycogen synthase